VKKLILFILFCFVAVAQPLFAQQVEIAVSRKIKTSENPLSGPFVELLAQRMESTYDEIVTRLKSNGDIRFVKEYHPATTNFILRMSVTAFFEEKPEGDQDGQDHNTGYYRIEVFFKLIDPHQNLIVYIPHYSMTITSNENLSERELFNRFWPGFLQNGIAKAQASELVRHIKPQKITVSGNITFTPENGDKPKADGHQISLVSVQFSGRSVGVGEAREHSITTYKLTCEKGTFVKTHSREIEFSGSDYVYDRYGGKKHFEVKYKAYQCSNYNQEEKNYDKFNLIQIRRMNDETPVKITEKKVDFECKQLYDVYAYYNAPGFVKVGLKWENTEVKFPEDDKKPAIINFADLDMNKSSEEELFDKKGNKISLSIPFTLVYPGEKRTIYGGPGDDPPNVLYVTSLGGLGVFENFYVKLNNGLNRCEITRVNNGPVYLDFSFDLFGGAGPVKQYYDQKTVDCLDPKTFKMAGMKIKRNPYPIDFPPVFITKEDIEKFKKFEKVEKTVSNGRATLKVVFLHSGEQK